MRRGAWREHVDLIAKAVMINQQTCYGVTTTPKGRTRRGVPMTSTLENARRLWLAAVCAPSGASYARA